SYNDLVYYLFRNNFDNKYHQSLDSFVQERIYKPMQMFSTTYWSRRKFDVDKIVAMANDKIYRNQLLHGFVQDEGAAMMGGVAGHAGLFASAEDLAKLMQMYLNGGTYGGVQILKP